MNSDRQFLWTMVLYICSLAIIMLLISSCSSTTMVKTCNLQGKVEDIQGEPLNNAIVMLYKKVQLSQTISALKTQYPNHGAPLNFYTNFDHRKMTPAYSVTSDDEGNFSFPNIKADTYCIVAIKEDYGLKYLLDYTLDENVIGLIISVNPIIELPPVIGGIYTLESGRSYYTSSDLMVLPEGNLEVGSDVRLYIKPGHNVSIHGKLSTGTGSSLIISSLFGLYTQTGSIGLEKYGSITILNQDACSFMNILVNDSTLGLRIVDSSNIFLENVLVNAYYQGLVLVDSESANLVNCSVNGSLETMRAAITVENSQDVVIERCHLWDNYHGVQFASSTGVEVSNNLFNNNSVKDIFILEGGAGEIKNNTFIASNTAIYGFSGQALIMNNDIQAQIGINIERVGAWFSAKFNNLNCVEIGIKSRCMAYHSSTIHLDCTHNYWGTTNLETIAQLIYDRNDVDINDENYSLLVTEIDFMPISNTPNNAGVFD